MKIQIAPLTEDLTPAIQEFNRRIQPSGVTPLCDSPASCWLPRAPGKQLFEEYYLAIDGSAVRGGYVLRHTPALLNGQSFRMANFGQPTSEGIVDKRYGLVAIQLLQDAEKREPNLFGVGMGGWDEPVTRLLKAARWNVREVPFYFKVVRPFRLLRTAPVIRKTRWHTLAADLAAFSGLGALGLAGLNAAKTSNVFHGRRVLVEVMDSFSHWADIVWEQSAPEYSLVARRDSTTLNTLYRPGDPRYIRLRITERARTLGWAVVMDSVLNQHNRMGSVRAGLIVDCMAPVKHAEKVVQAATRFLIRRGVDLVRSHQSHAAWGAALRRTGFLPGPSFFMFAASRQMSAILDEVDPDYERIFFNRGDGDGPLNLGDGW
jgi:hypothetical protein